MNKEFNIPEFQLSKNEKIWLEAVYDQFKKGEKVDYKYLRVKLIDILPMNFDVRGISNHLINYKGEKLTIIGVELIDPDCAILNKANQVIEFIKKRLTDEASMETIEVSEIVNKTSVEGKYIQLILDSIGRFGSFWNSASINGEAYTTLSFVGDDENRVFHQYLYFQNIELLIDRYFEEEKNRENKANSKSFISVKGTSGKGVGLRGKREYAYDNYLEDDGRIFFNFEPIFKSKVEHIDPSLCFVLMPFTQPWSSRVYTKLIKPVVENLRIQCLRADNLTGPIVVEDIWTKINQSAFIIADVTGRNPNVMYELGIVHAIGKPAILITQEIEQIPFDFVHLRHYPYQDNIESFEAFSKELNERIKSLYQDYFPEFELKPLT